MGLRRGRRPSRPSGRDGQLKSQPATSPPMSRSISSSMTMRPDTAAKPCDELRARLPPSSGAGFTSPAGTSMTSETPSTTTPKSRRPCGDSTDSTMMTVSGVYSARGRLKRMRRSTIGTIEPRRLSTPSTCACACGMRVTGDQPRISCTRRMSTPYVSSPERERQHLVRTAVAASRLPAVICCQLSTCLRLIGIAQKSSQVLLIAAGALTASLQPAQLLPAPLRAAGAAACASPAVRADGRARQRCR